ncbi:GNAT family N-acetyltransferase [Streptomyces sp. KL116D]|uniref:GNAT family N-acetyltransferase n=1 Tax=Streptomyces sp. KL116D TaxID=3045152 RepID=UPI003556C30B
MSTTNTLRTAVPDDAPEIGSLLARAFDDDPMMRCFFPDATTRQASMERYFTTVFGRQYVHHGLCERTASAAAFWVPAEDQAKAVPDADTVQELRAILGDRAALFGRTVEAAAAHTPAEPHWSLALIGADPAAQGQGQGAALLRSGLARADAAGMPVYLESSKESNVPVYEHFGFKVRDELTVPAGGPVLWTMWRPAAA